jgi:divalent metal cation (Fe/Co/Zn/Cd) transporter
MPAAAAPAVRAQVMRLQALTLAWMSVEAAVSLGAAWHARSLALAAFGGDSVVELASAAIVFGHFRGSAFLSEARAARTAGALLLALAGVVMAACVLTLLGSVHPPEPSPVGIVLLVAAAVVMPWLASRKRALATVTGSAALKADATQSSLCGYMAWIALGGLVANAWWTLPWADSVAALALVPLIVREGWSTFRAARLCNDCC